MANKNLQDFIFFKRIFCDVAKVILFFNIWGCFTYYLQPFIIFELYRIRFGKAKFGNIRFRLPLRSPFIIFVNQR